MRVWAAGGGGGWDGGGGGGGCYGGGDSDNGCANQPNLSNLYCLSCVSTRLERKQRTIQVD